MNRSQHQEGNRSRVALTWLAALIVGWHLWPLVVVWLPSAGDSSAASTELSISWPLLAISVCVAAAAALLAVAIGGVLACLLTMTDMPGKTWWGAAAMLPFLAPPTVWAMGQVYCFGAGGLLERWFGDAARGTLDRLNHGQYLSTALVLGEVYAPLAMLLIGRGVARLPQIGFDAARLTLPPARLLLWMAAALRLEIASAGLLAFTLALGNFAVPHVLQCRLSIIEVYMRNANYLDQRGAMWAAAPLTAIALLALTAWLSIERHADYAATTMAPTATWRLGRWRWPVCMQLAAMLSVMCFLPVAALLAECQSWQYFTAALADAWFEIENTLWIASASAAIACLGGAVVARWLEVSGHRIAAWVAMLPLAVPPLILGLAWSRSTHRAWPIDLAALGDSSWLVILALAARSWPFAIRIQELAQRRIAPAEREAAWLSRLSWPRRLRWIVIPMTGEYLATAAIVGFVLAAGEVEISQLLCAPGGGTLALRLFTFLHFGPTHVAASLAVMQLIVCLLPVLAYLLWTDRWLHLI